jgi:hypothetical protein
MHDVTLTGIDGSTFLGFMSALGVLEVAHATRLEGEAPLLSWRQAGTWQPTIASSASFEELSERILLDARSQAIEEVLSFRYVKIEKNGPKPVASLSPPLAVLRATLSCCLDPDRTRSDILAALMCESCVDSMKDEKAPSTEDLVRFGVPHDRGAALHLSVNPTPFDFTSRNVQFLDQIRRIRDVLTRDVIAADLLQGMGAPSERIMRWDARVDMPGALFDGAEPMPRPAAEWLAFRAVPFFPLVESSGTARMSGFSGRRKSGEFRWMLWDRPLYRDVIKSALATRWEKMTQASRVAHGVTAGFAVSFRKDATGYDGALSYSRPVEPPRANDSLGLRLS